MWDKIKRHKVLIVLGIIVSLAFFVRVWNIQELFIFKMDQARDIRLVQESYDGGAGELPLLGPRAAKTYLRLGPIFYYFEYISMWLAGNKSPLAVVWPDLILSILTIPLFYYFLRQAFSQKISLMTTAVFASSFFLTQYSHFAWNPNSIPFWSLLFFLGMYKVVTKSIKSKVYKVEGSSPEIGGWLLAAVIGYGVASQLHFTAMLAYPLIAVVFGVLSWKTRWWLKISWKHWLGAVAVLGVFYLPMMFSEICTHGDNWVQFKYALSGRGKEEFSLYAKLCQSLKLHSEYFYYSLSSFGGGEGKFFIVGYLVAIIGAFLMVIKKFKIFSQSQNSRQVFFLLIFVWFVIIGLLYTKLAFNVLKPRYWLLNVPIAFIILAIWLDYGTNWLNGLKHRGKTSVLKVLKLMGMLVVGGLVFVNLYAVGNWYWMVQKQQDTESSMWDLKLKDENKISYGQLKKVVEYISGDVLALAKKEGKDVCFYTTGEYRPVYDYIFEKQGVSNKNFLEDEEIDISVIRRISFGSDTNERCLFLAIDHKQRREIPRIPKDRKEEFEKVENGKMYIGFVTVWHVIRKVEDTNIKEQTNYKVQTTKDSQNKINSGANENISREQQINKDSNERMSKEEMTEMAGEGVVKKDKIIDGSKKNKKPKRKERVRWKDVFNCE
jgi:hypothetical protein